MCHDSADDADGEDHPPEPFEFECKSTCTYKHNNYISEEDEDDLVKELAKLTTTHEKEVALLRKLNLTERDEYCLAYSCQDGERWALKYQSCQCPPFDIRKSNEELKKEYPNKPFCCTEESYLNIETNECINESEDIVNVEEGIFNCGWKTREIREIIEKDSDQMENISCIR